MPLIKDKEKESLRKEFSQKLEAGKNYYVEYSFKRVGKISKPDLMKVGETDKAAYQPASLAAAF